MPAFEQVPHNSPEPESRQAELIREGRERLLEHFAERARQTNLRILDHDSAAGVIAQWYEVISAAVVGDAEADLTLTGPMGEYSVTVLAVASDDEALYFLTCIERWGDRLPAFITSNDRLGYLAPGAAMGTILAVPKNLSPQEVARGQQEDGEDVVTAMPITDRRSFEMESARFGRGDLGGVFGDFFLSELQQSEAGAFKVWNIDTAVSCKNAEHVHAFHCADEEGQHYIFEAALEQTSGTFFMSVSAPLAEGGAESMPAVPRSAAAWTAIEEALADRGYHETSLSPTEEYPHPERIFASDLKGFWRDWDPGLEWTLRVENCYLNSDSSPNKLLVQISIRDAEGIYYLPLDSGSEALTSDDPMFAFFEATPKAIDSQHLQYHYRLRMISFDPAIGLEPLAECLRANVMSSRLGAYILASIAVSMPDEKLDPSLVPVAARRVSENRGLSEEDGEELSPAAHGFERFLCFHRQGAHMVSITADDAGVIDLGSDVVSRHFFPGLKKF